MLIPVQQPILFHDTHGNIKYSQTPVDLRRVPEMGLESENSKLDAWASTGDGTET